MIKNSKQTLNIAITLFVLMLASAPIAPLTSFSSIFTTDADNQFSNGNQKSSFEYDLDPVVPFQSNPHEVILFSLIIVFLNLINFSNLQIKISLIRAPPKLS